MFMKSTKGVNSQLLINQLNKKLTIKRVAYFDVQGLLLAHGHQQHTTTMCTTLYVAPSGDIKKYIYIYKFDLQMGDPCFPHC